MTGFSSPDLTPEQIRCAADGESPSGDVPAPGAEATDERIRAAIDFERQLRAAVGRTMGAERAPIGLAEQIRAAMAAVSTTDSIHLDDVRDGLIPSGSEPARATAAAAGVQSFPDSSGVRVAGDQSGTGSGSLSFLRWLDSPRRANAAAVAAVLALVIGAIGFGIVMPTISQWGQVESSQFVEQAATFAANEHGRCSSEDVRSGKLTQFTNLADAREFLSRHLNRPLAGIHLPDLSGQGYEFVGVAACHVPGGLPSAHVVWRSVEADAQGRRALVSGFVTLDRDQFELRGASAADIRVSGVSLPDGSTCSRTVRVIREGGLAFLVVCCKEESLADCAERLTLGIGG